MLGTGHQPSSTDISRHCCMMRESRKLTDPGWCQTFCWHRRLKFLSLAVFGQLLKKGRRLGVSGVVRILVGFASQKLRPPKWGGGVRGASGGTHSLCLHSGSLRCRVGCLPLQAEAAASGRGCGFLHKKCRNQPAVVMDRIRFACSCACFFPPSFLHYSCRDS
jgi:hypothetical protein